jgi:uncharacterized protein
VSEPDARALYNLIEPAGLIAHFLAAPPRDFSTFELTGGAPAFSAAFDPLTTVDPAVRRKMDALPLARRWRSWLRLQTGFVGTTVSEYALFPRTISPSDFVRRLLNEVAPRYPMLIIKDIPTDAVLIGDEAYAYSRRLIEACRASGFLLVEGQALAYVPIDFTSVDDFLARFSRSRRKDIRRKLRSAAALTVDTVRTGDAAFNDDETLAAFYALYLNVYRQSEIHFDLLSADFFKALLQDARAGGVVFVYRRGGETIGYNVCFVESGVLVDKYVGFAYPRAREHNLYAVSWFHNLEYALAHDLHCYVAGWTDPEIKRHLGARFTLTQHAVYLRSPLLKAMLRPLKRFFETDHRWHAEHVTRADS